MHEAQPALSERVALLVAEIEAGKAWGSVLLPLEHGDTRGATLNEAEEALCVVVDRLRAELEAAKNEWVQGYREGVEDVAGLRAEVAHLRAGISWARGMCSDEEPHTEIDHMLGEILSGSPRPIDDNKLAGEET